MATQLNLLFKMYTLWGTPYTRLHSKLSVAQIQHNYLNEQNTNFYLPTVIFPLIYFGSLDMSAIAAIGIPQFATGPQKCVLQFKTSLISDGNYYARFFYLNK